MYQEGGSRDPETVPQNQDVEPKVDVPEIKLGKDRPTKLYDFDIDKGLIEQLSEKEIEKIEEWAARVVKQWHDSSPDYVFLTESGSIPP